MINLIPIEEKKESIKDFYYRLLFVSLVMLTFFMVIFILAILPTYFFSFEKKVSTSKKLEIQKKEVMPEIDQQAVAAIKDLDARLIVLEKARKNKYIFSEMVVNEIISKKVDGIKIDGISYKNDSLNGRTINIVGLAKDRVQLLLFRRALEGDNLFRNVDLPISNFVKGYDIRFSLSLVSK